MRDWTNREGAKAPPRTLIPSLLGFGVTVSLESSPMSNTKPLIAVTLGDPAGIGPEIVVKAMAR
jgi:hypothetical protein